MKSIYSCGPTVYDRSHIGNLRSYYLTYLCYLNDPEAKIIINVTDLDDKIFKRCKNLPDLKKLTNHFLDLFQKDLSKLINDQKFMNHIDFVKVTETLEKLMDLIEDLTKKEVFIKKDLAIEYNAPEPENFAVWKYRNEGLTWSRSEIKEGQPGWHIECANIIRLKLEELKTKELSLHVGGKDLKILHHENEMKILKELGLEVKEWLHNGQLLMNGVKMSKSLQNTLSIDEVEEMAVLRFIFLRKGILNNLNYCVKFYRDSKSKLNQYLKQYYSRKNRNLPISKETLPSRETYAEWIESINLLTLDLNSEKTQDLSFFDKMHLLNNTINLVKLPEIKEEHYAVFREHLIYKKKKDYRKSDALRAKLLEVGLSVILFQEEYILIPNSDLLLKD